MANITVRNLPHNTKESLRIHAAQYGISLEAYARQILQAASNQNPFDQIDILELAEQYFGPTQGVDIVLPERSSARKPIAFD